MITLATYSSWVSQPTWILFTPLGNVARARNPMTCAPGDLAWVQPHESSTHILRSGSRALLSETGEGSFCSSNLDILCSVCVRRSWGYTSLDMHGIKVHVLIVVVSRAYKTMNYSHFVEECWGCIQIIFTKHPGIAAIAVGCSLLAVNTPGFQKQSSTAVWVYQDHHTSAARKDTKVRAQ